MKKTIINYEKLHSHFNRNTINTIDNFLWINYSGFLNDKSFLALIESFPSIELFEEHKDLKRIHNQAPHNRYYLAFEKSIHHPIGYSGRGVIQLNQLEPIWQDFLNELMDKTYENFVKSVLGLVNFKARYDWHIGIKGTEVSPHIDASTKLASHLFYFNTTHDWKEDWGGRTVMLAAKKTTVMNPLFTDFKEKISIENLNNKSLLFKNSGNAWHGVEALKCPKSKFRRLFNVIFELGNADTLSLRERANM